MAASPDRGLQLCKKPRGSVRRKADANGHGFRSNPPKSTRFWKFYLKFFSKFLRKMAPIQLAITIPRKDSSSMPSRSIHRVASCVHWRHPECIGRVFQQKLLVHFLVKRHSKPEKLQFRPFLDLRFSFESEKFLQMLICKNRWARLRPSSRVVVNHFQAMNLDQIPGFWKTSKMDFLHFFGKN